MLPEDLNTNTGETPDAGGAPPPAPPMNERPADGPGSGRSDIRKSLESGFEKARKDDEKRDRAPPRDRDRDRQTGKFVSRARQDGLVGTPEEAPAEGQEAPAEGQEAPQQHAVPEGWSNEAKAEWDSLHPAVQAAVAKREADMAKGVENLRKGYAEIDKAIAPRMQLIRNHNQTPGAAVNQLFSWFEALTANPVVAFPALAESFKFDLLSIPGLAQAVYQRMQQQPQQGQQPQQSQQPQQEEVPAYVRQLQDELNQLRQGMQHQYGAYQNDKWSQLNTILNNWSKDKPFFNEVRQTMGQLMQANMVPPLANGDADLDKAYDMALWAMPEIRQQVLAQQQQKAQAELKEKADKERRAQQEAADKARRANGGSLAQGAPGNPVQPDQGKSKKGKSVRESIMEAREELLNR